MLITIPWGIIQINALENYSSSPAWIFPIGSSYWGPAYRNFFWDDIFFVVVCSSLFYWFFHVTRNINDVIPEKYYMWIVSFFILVETQLYHICGQGCKDLVVVYSVVPVIMFTFYCIITGFRPNVTRALVFLVMVLAVSVSWDVLAAINSWWVYDITSDAFLPREFYFRDRLALGITPQYAISGWIVMYSTCMIYGRQNANTYRNEKTSSN